MKYAIFTIIITLACQTVGSVESGGALANIIDKSLWVIDEKTDRIVIRYNRQIYIYNSMGLPSQIQPVDKPNIDYNLQAVNKQGSKSRELEIVLLKTGITKDSLNLINDSRTELKTSADSNVDDSVTKSGLYLFNDMPMAAVDGAVYYVLTPINLKLSIYPDDANGNYYRLLASLGFIN